MFVSATTQFISSLDPRVAAFSPDQIFACADGWRYTQDQIQKIAQFQVDKQQCDDNLVLYDNRNATTPEQAKMHLQASLLCAVGTVQYALDKLQGNSTVQDSLTAISAYAQNLVESGACLTPPSFSLRRKLR